MSTTFTVRIELPGSTDFKALYDTTGWGASTCPPEFYARALAGSWSCRAVYDDGQLVGFGRVISDGVLHAFITEMIVHPAHQGQGIGQTILQGLLDDCHHAGVRDIQLFAALGKQAFYQRHGFEPRPQGAPGMQYINL